MELFPKSGVVGVFRGFREGGLEFHADLAIPYRQDLHAIPMHGQFLLVQLETPDEAVLGRITSFSSEGKLSVGSGEEFNIRAVREGRDVPDDLREQYLKYRTNIRVLGVVRANGRNRLEFVPSHRRLPHVGSPVAFPSETVLQEIVGHGDEGATIGHLALGEYIYDPARKEPESWMRLKSPEACVKFNIRSLISRRSFILARAGFGKSNLNKLLFSELYRETPTTEKRGGKKVPVGTIIFDPDGEYFWPDDKGRPGLCDVAHLDDKLVIFTSRRAPSEFYEAFTASRVRLDIRELRPSDVISIALPPERQDQQNVAKLRGMQPVAWRKLVDLIHTRGHEVEDAEVGELIRADINKQQAEITAARSNVTLIVRMLHDPSSQMLGLLLQALKAGKLCVVDVSQMRGTQGFVLAGIILRQIFSRNQEELTKAEPDTIPTIAVIEEAQSVLREGTSASEPFVSWVKEGRKYDLGAVLVTQQPGSIPDEILSQGDNWFLFHLLSAGDLGNVRHANAHFSNDILSSLLNEPIVGQGVFWSSAKKERAYPIPLWVASFEAAHAARDPKYDKPPVRTFAASLRGVREGVQRRGVELGAVTDPPDGEEPTVDMALFREQVAVESVRSDATTLERLQGGGMSWRGVQAVIEKALPPTTHERAQEAYQLVPTVLDIVLGHRAAGHWHSFKGGKNGATWVRAGRKP